MGTSTIKPDGTGWITRRYFLCRKCNSLIRDTVELDNNQRHVKSYTETYLEEDLDYTDINDIKIKPGAVCYEKQEKVEDN